MIWKHPIKPYSDLRYYTYAEDEIAIITTPPPITEIIQNHKGYDDPGIALNTDGWTHPNNINGFLY